MAHYAPGTALLLAAGDALLLVDDVVDTDGMAADLAGPAPVGAVLDRIARAGLTSAPSFVLLVGPTLVLRGSGAADVEAGGALVELTADGAATWREHRLTDDARIAELRLEVPTGRWLALTNGVVLASAVRPGVAGSAVVAPVPARTAVGQEAVVSSEPDRHEREPVSAAPRPPLTAALTAVHPQKAEPQPPALVEQVPLTRSAPAAVSEPTLVEVPPGDYDHLFGHTVVRTVEDAAVRPADVPFVDLVPAADLDHDGHTVLASELRARRAAVAPAVSTPPVGGATVLAVRCPAGHVNRPGAEGCRSCGAGVVQGLPLWVTRPSLGLLRSPDGTVVELDRTVLIGRAPEVQRMSATELPRLLTVASPQQDVSRNHLEVRVEGWDLLAVDVSSNGTVLTRPGQEPRRLHPGEPTLVLEGSTFDLGDGVVLLLEAPR